jgi:hypothetical protein
MRTHRRQSRRTNGPARHPAHDPSLSTHRNGQILIGDKNYFGTEFETTLTEEGLTLLRPAR